MTAGIALALDNALFNVLCYFAPPSQAASQEARYLASDARVEHLARKDRVRRIVEIIDEHGWHNVRDAEVLRAFTFTPDPKPCRLARRVEPKRLAKPVAERPERRYIRRKR